MLRVLTNVFPTWQGLQALNSFVSLGRYILNVISPSLFMVADQGYGVKQSRPGISCPLKSCECKYFGEVISLVVSTMVLYPKLN